MLLALTLCAAGSVRAQPSVSLQTAMLYGVENAEAAEDLSSRAQPDLFGHRRDPLQGISPERPGCAEPFGVLHSLRHAVSSLGQDDMSSRNEIERRSPLYLPSDTTLADPWFGRDKALHVTLSVLMTLSAQYVLTDKLGADASTAVPIAAGAAFSVGFAKEVADSRRPVNPLFSTRDLVADAVGVALAVGLILL